MRTPDDIVMQLSTFLPFFTDRFSNFLDITIMGTSTATELIVNAPDHGLTDCVPLVIVNGLIPNPINAVAAYETQVQFTTTDVHDLVSPPISEIDAPFEITMSGFTDDDWNTTHVLQYVPDRNNFVIDFPSGVTVLPILNGEEKLDEDRNAGIKGLHLIATIIDPDTFTIMLVNAVGNDFVQAVPDLPVGAIIQSPVIVPTTRIAAAADIQRAIKMYTKQTNLDEIWAFIIMGDVDASKDRHTLNDATAGFTAQDLAMLRFLQNYSVAVFFPTHDELSGVNAQNLAYGEIFDAMMQSMYAYSFEDPDSLINYVSVCTGHGPSAPYNSAYYIHVYDWQLPTAIDFRSGFTEQQDVAFRDIAMTFYNNKDEAAQLTANLNLDDEE